MIEKYLEILRHIGEGMHLGSSATNGIAGSIAIITLLAVGLLLYFLITFIIKKTVYVIIKRTPSKFDDLLIKNRVFTRICLLIPAILIKYYADDVLLGFPDMVEIIIKFVKFMGFVPRWQYRVCVQLLPNTKPFSKIRKSGLSRYSDCLN